MRTTVKTIFLVLIVLYVAWWVQTETMRPKASPGTSVARIEASMEGDLITYLRKKALVIRRCSTITCMKTRKAFVAR